MQQYNNQGRLDSRRLYSGQSTQSRTPHAAAAAAAAAARGSPPLPCLAPVDRSLALRGHGQRAHGPSSRNMDNDQALSEFVEFQICPAEFPRPPCVHARAQACTPSTRPTAAISGRGGSTGPARRVAGGCPPVCRSLDLCTSSASRSGRPAPTGASWSTELPPRHGSAGQHGKTRHSSECPSRAGHSEVVHSLP